MNSAFDKEHLPSSVMLVLAIVIFLASIVGAVFPKPNATQILSKAHADSQKAMVTGKTAEKQTDEDQDKIGKLVWAGTSDSIGTAALGIVNKAAAEQNVKILTFRPQRVVDAGDVTQVPYVVNVSGSFLNVSQMVRKLETTQTKLAVELLQIGSSDESTDQVTGTIGIESYIVDAVPTSTTDSKASKASSSVKGSKPLQAGATKSGEQSEGSTVIKTTQKTTVTKGGISVGKG